MSQPLKSRIKSNNTYTSIHTVPTVHTVHTRSEYFSWIFFWNEEYIYFSLSHQVVYFIATDSYTQVISKGLQFLKT